MNLKILLVFFMLPYRYAEVIEVLESIPCSIKCIYWSSGDDILARTVPVLKWLQLLALVRTSAGGGPLKGVVQCNLTTLGAIFFSNISIRKR